MQHTSEYSLPLILAWSLSNIEVHLGIIFFQVQKFTLNIFLGKSCSVNFCHLSDWIGAGVQERLYLFRIFKPSVRNHSSQSTHTIKLHSKQNSYQKFQRIIIIIIIH